MIIKFANERYQIEVSRGESVKSLKYKIYEKLNIRPEAQRLTCQGYPLVDEQVLQEESIICLVLQMS